MGRIRIVGNGGVRPNAGMRYSGILGTTSFGFAGIPPWGRVAMSVSSRNILNLLVLSYLVACAGYGAAAENSPQAFPRKTGSDSVVTVVNPTPGATRPGAFENQTLAIAGSASRRERPEPQERREYVMPSILPALFYVGLICGGFILAMHLARKYLPGGKRLFTHPSMEILGRTHIDQKRYLSLVRVGKRILVVGVSPDEMRSLSEIVDEGEVTEIMEVARPKTETGLTIFQRLFQKNVIDAEAAEKEEEIRHHALELEENLSSLRERVRSIREHEEPLERMDVTG